MSALFLLAVLAAPPPLTLQEATDIALERANDMVQAREDLVLVDTEYLEALSAVLPRLDLEVSAGGVFAGRRILESRNPVPAQLPTEFPQVNFGPFRDAQTNNYSHPDISLGFTVRQVLFDGGRSWTALAQVDDSRDARTSALEHISRLVRSRVAVAFYELEKANQQVQAQQAQLLMDEQQVQRAQGLVEAGRGGRADLATARRNLARDQIQMRTARSTVATARRQFNLELGRSVVEPVQLKLPKHLRTSTSTMASPFVPGFDKLCDLARARHPNLRSLRAELERTDKAVQFAVGDYWPVVALQGSYRRSSRRPDRVFANPFTNYFATFDLVVQWNLFAGLSSKAQVQRALVAHRKAQAEYDNSERLVFSEIAAVQERLAAQTEIVALAAAEIQAALEAVRLARGLYQGGRGTALELRTAELGQTQAQLSAVSARLEIEIARAQLQQAVGVDDFAAP